MVGKPTSKCFVNFLVSTFRSSFNMILSTVKIISIQSASWPDTIFWPWRQGWHLVESRRVLWDFAHNAAIEPLESLFLVVCKLLTPGASMRCFLALGTTEMIKTIWQLRFLPTAPWPGSWFWFFCMASRCWAWCCSRASHDCLWGGRIAWFWHQNPCHDHGVRLWK